MAHWPRQSLRPVLSTTQIAVSFCDTSKPTNLVIEPPPMVRTAGQQRPDRSIMEDLCPHRDYPMSIHAPRCRVPLFDMILDKHPHYIPELSIAWSHTIRNMS